MTSFGVLMPRERIGFGASYRLSLCILINPMLTRTSAMLYTQSLILQVRTVLFVDYTKDSNIVRSRGTTPQNYLKMIVSHDCIRAGHDPIDLTCLST